MSAPEKINRDTTTPFLLKLFYKKGGHNHVDDFHPIGPSPPHVQIFSWFDATLNELAHLISDNLPQLLPDPAIGTRLDFDLIVPDLRAPLRNDGYGRYQKRSLGSIVIRAGGQVSTQSNGNENGIRSNTAVYTTGDEEKTLHDVKFVVGDYLDCAIFPPLANGEVAPPPRNFGGRSGPPPRENGFGGPPFHGRGGGGRGRLPLGEWRRGDDIPPGSNGGSRRGGRGRGW